MATHSIDQRLPDSPPGAIRAFFRLARQRTAGDYQELALATFDQLLLAFSRQPVPAGATDDCVVEVHYTEQRRRSARVAEAHSVRVLAPGEPYPATRLCPAAWVADESAYRDLLDLTGLLTSPYRELIDTVFADEGLLKRFVQAPSSIGGHHNAPGGNLIHAVAVSRIASAELESFADYCDADTALVACLLHDVGKADEYAATANGQWRLTDRGRLIGHKLTSCEIVSRALSARPGLLPTDRQLMLLHCLAASGAPDYVGLRPAASIEAFIVSFADRLSATGELMVRQRLPDRPWGRRHHHLPRAPFRILSVPGPAPSRSSRS